MKIFLKTAQILCCLLLSSIACANGLSLKIIGDEKQGFAIEMLYDSQPIARHNNGGEFSMVLENCDRSEKVEINNWKAASCKGDSNNVTLSGTAEIKQFMTNVEFEVIYKVVNANTIKKQIKLYQRDIPQLYYQMENRLEPTAVPQSYWSFEEPNSMGGPLREIYPAAGFKTDKGIAVGLLTDAGHRNLWTRNNRRRAQSGWTGLKVLADPYLHKVADLSERAGGKNYVSLTFGQLYDYTCGSTKILRTIPSQWASHEGADVNIVDGILTIKGTISEKGFLGAHTSIPVRIAHDYCVRFKYRCDRTAATRFWRVRGKDTISDIGFYEDALPASPNSWRQYEMSAAIPPIGSDSTMFIISKGYNERDGKFKLEVKDFEIIETSPSSQPYHILKMGEPAIKTVFIFAEPAQSLRDLRLASQVRLSEGLGFEGTEVEKIFYADLMMLCWITDHKDMTPLMVPSLNYAPDMYNRDSFWSATAIYDRRLSEAIWNKWAATQEHSGAIDTIITPCIGSMEAKGNEATAEFIWWALINKRRYNSSIPMDKIRLALEFCRSEFDPDGNGKVMANFVLGQNDLVNFEKKTDTVSVSQGMYAVTLRAAKELGCDVPEEYIKKAEQAYRDFYDPNRGHLLMLRNYPDIISVSDLLPEFVSLWLWNKPILTDEMVINHLDAVPIINDCAPIVIMENKQYLTPENLPFDEGRAELYKNHKFDGQYYNGGSWLREEYCAYVAGAKHGWKEAPERMKKRLLAEINLNPSEPFSHEFIPTALDIPGCWWPSCRVFAWNVFVLTANEVAGIRNPGHDPFYEK